MTALITRIDLDGEVAIVADGCASDPAKSGECARRDEWKSARLNDLLAVGFAGHVDYGNQILCRLFGRKDLQDQRGWIRVVHVIEQERLELPGAMWEETESAISRLIQGLRSGISVHRPLDSTVAPMNLTMMMVGRHDGEPSICVWHERYGWNAVEVGPKVPGEIGATVATGPQGASLPVPAFFEKSGIPLEERAQEAIAHAASLHPGKVNTYTTVRRASRGFELEIYDDGAS